MTVAGFRRAAGLLAALEMYSCVLGQQRGREPNTRGFQSQLAMSSQCEVSFLSSVIWE